MIYSMTGYGKGAAADNNFSIEVEIKSVNSRFLDIFFKLPSSLQSKEYELREFVKSKLKRGKVNIFVQLKSNERDIDFPVVNKDKVKAYLSVVKDLKKAAKITEKVKLDHLLAFKDLLLPDDIEFAEKEFNTLKKALDNAISELIKMRKKEGKELAKDLIKRVNNIDDKITLIEKESGDSVKEYFGILKEKVKLLIENITDYSDRLELELALLAEKAEITEECVRLRSHIKFFLESIEQDEDPGRKLNFLCQEMNREVNTISSKSVSTSITHNAVLMKEEIERIREQIQNIE
jgi:uncharacterized protein (TIGR00255 family)